MTAQPRTKTSERRKEQFASAYSSFRKKWGISWRGMTPEDRRSTIEQLFVPPGETAQSYVLRFTALLSLSVVIAFCGLHANSTAVVIGAMLVAPLMEPILAMAGAMIMDWRQRLLRSVVLVAWGALLSVALAALLGTLLPDRIAVIPVPEILARTRPTLLDLGVALGAGAAGAYTLVKRVSVAMPGVAVAVALVPPLTVIGITLEEHHFDMAMGATLLFATNLFAILLAAATVLLLAGFTPAAIRQRSRTWLRTSISTTLVGVVAIAIPLTIYTSLTFRKELIRDAVIDSVEEWRGFLTQQVLGIGLQDGQIVVNLASETPPLAALANSIASQVGEDVEIRVRWVPLTELEVAGVYRGKTKRIRRFRPRSFEPLY